MPQNGGKEIFMLKYGLVGFGGLAKVHFGNTEELGKIHNDIKLVAICDVDETKFTSNVATNLGEDNSSLDLSAYNLYTDPDEMFEKEELDFIVTAIPTYLHDTIAIKAMEKGIHVFSEKPMAITLERAEKMLDAARKNNVKLMIGQCVRYFPEYQVLKEAVDSGKYGKVVKAEFARISSTPRWSWQNWYMDGEKSGGAALDLHVHDVDYINFIFGKPKTVYSLATNEVSLHDSITTLFDYGDKVVVATGDWGHTDKYPFLPSYRVRFENATIEMAEGKVTLYTNEEAKEMPYEPGNGYLREVADFVSCIKENKESEVNPPEDTLVTLKMAFAEKKSADTHTIVEF